MTERTVKCWHCQRVEVSAIEPDGYCTDCRMRKAYGWRRMAEAMMRGIEPEEDRKSIH